MVSSGLEPHNGAKRIDSLLKPLRKLIARSGFACRGVARRGVPACCLLTLMGPACGVAADGPSSSMFSFGGFGTVGAVHSNLDQADFVSAPFEAVGAGYTRRWSAKVDSLIGAQIAADLTPQLSAVLMAIAQQNYDAGFRPHVEWANLKYQFTPELSVRIGRTALGLFLITDSRNIGFSNPWVRPPIELYGLVTVTSNDGIDASYRSAMGAASNTVQVTTGRTTYKYPVPNSTTVGTAKSRDLIALVDTLQRGFSTLRLTYGQAHVSIPAFDPLFDAFRQFGPRGVGIAELYDVADRIVSFFGLSARYEPGRLFAMAEWARVNTHSVLGEKTGWYVSSGYLLGRVTPYATYAQVRADTNTSDPGLSLTGLPASQAGLAMALNAGLNASLAPIASQRTVSLGARWDILPSVDLKFQYDHTDLGANSQGWLTNLQPGFRLGSTVDLISATVDFVF